MLTRRHLALTAAQASAFAVLLGARRSHADAQAPSPLDALFTQFADEMLQRVPERATSLGLDVGKLAPLRAQVHEASLDAIAQDKRDTARRLGQLKAIDRNALTGLPAANYDTVLFSLQVDDEAGRLFDYGPGGARSPYVLSQLTGAYQSLPDFLDTQHPIKKADDANAYLARLEAFVRLMDQELEVFHHDAGRGVVPPGVYPSTTK